MELDRRGDVCTHNVHVHMCAIEIHVHVPQSYIHTHVQCVMCACPHAEVEAVFMPWLMDETEKALDKRILARVLLDCKYSMHTTQYSTKTPRVM